MRFHVLTLFPEMIDQGLGLGIIGRAVKKNIISIHAVDIRSYTLEKHGKVDDAPYGGGAGMLMQAQPVFDAHRAVAEGRRVRTLYVTPQGRTFDQGFARELAGEEELILLCGHYEGIDERVLEEVVTDQVSIGDYVLTGGELAAMVIIDAVARLVPGVLGNDASAEEESFHNDLLEYPQYTRPETWHGKPVPPVLLSGDHREIAGWRLEQSVERTRRNRPDLYEKYRERQDLLRRLSGKKRENIHMMEALRRGTGRICYDEGGDTVLYLPESRICMIRSVPAGEAGSSGMDRPEGRDLRQEREVSVLDACPEEAELFVTDSGPAAGLLEWRGCRTVARCAQFLYTRREPLPLRHRDIRRLGAESLDPGSTDSGCMEHFRAFYGEEAYGRLRERVRAGAVYGAFLEGRLAGVAGSYSGGSTGLLYVEEGFRRQGIGSSLEAYCIDRTLERGWVPYVYVSEEDEVSARMQEKLGLYRAGGSFRWLGRKKHLQRAEIYGKI